LALGIEAQSTDLRTTALDFKREASWRMTSASILERVSCVPCLYQLFTQNADLLCGHART